MKGSLVKLLSLILLFSSMFANNVLSMGSIKPMYEDTEFEVFTEDGIVYGIITTTLRYAIEDIHVNNYLVREGNTFSVDMQIDNPDWMGERIKKKEVIVNFGTLDDGEYKFIIKYRGEITHSFEFKVPAGEKKQKDKELSISIDYNYMNFEDPPVIVNGRVLIPLRSVFEELGCSLQWNDAQRKVYVKNDDSDIVLTAGSKEAIINNEIRILDVPADIINNRIYVPVRFVCESIGKLVYWNSFNREVQIFNSKVPGTLVSASEKYSRDYMNQLALYEDRVYFIGPNGGLYSMNMDFTDIQVVNKDLYASFIIHNGYIYSSSTLNGIAYSNGVPYSLLLNRGKLGGSEKERLLNLEDVKSYQISGDWIYFYTNAGNKRMSLDGKNFSDTFKASYPIKLDEIWYTDGRNKENTSTGKVENIYDDYMRVLYSDGEWIYFTDERSSDQNNNCLYRIKTDGTYLTRINDSKTMDVIVKDGWIYYLDYTSYIGNELEEKISLYRIKEDGTQREMLYSGLKTDIPDKNFAGFAGDWIFYRDRSNIYKTKIDGSETKVFQLNSLNK